MLRITYFSLLLISIFGCQSTQETATTTASPFTVLTDENPAWQTQQLRLLPIVATPEYIHAQEGAQTLKTLGEMLEQERFRVTEKKPYGRFDDNGAVNQLTVQNKTDEAVFLMAGDVVQGGNQDRVVGEDQIIAARSIQDIEVFCVEHGRWTWNGQHDKYESDDKIFAFRGYYNVASSRIRKAVAARNQERVWEEVASVTSHYGVASPTEAYAGLEDNDEFVNQRATYQRFFSGKLTEDTPIVGFVAISGNQLLGADVFGHPQLLQRKFDALINGYIIDALTIGNHQALPEEKLQSFIQQLQSELQQGGYRHNGTMIHTSVLAH
ncbi:MAG: DUF6569 family protein [Saprospiraceae bacterium]